MSPLNNTRWTNFQIEAEIDTYGAPRIVKAQNELYDQVHAPDRLDILRRLIGSPGPGLDGQTFIQLTCTCDFEPHGRASETWEMVWTLEIPLVQHHWKNVRGEWIRGSNNAPMRFRGRYPDDVIREAIVFMSELKAQDAKANSQERDDIPSP